MSSPKPAAGATGSAAAQSFAQTSAELLSAIRLGQELILSAVSQLQGDLDAEQLQLYDFALCEAELSAAASCLRRIEQPPPIAGQATTPANPMMHELGNTFAAESLCSVLQRFTQHQQDLSWPHTALEDFYERIDTNARPLQAASKLQNLGQRLCTLLAEQPQALDWDLAQDKNMMRDTFRRFSNEVVEPLAQEIHQQDRMIPDAILNPLKAMGCFGLSIPERFGGLQTDGAEDSLGMVVVTEALSRGSLGAAGSLITRPEIMARALIEGGTAEQQTHWLPKLADGSTLCAVSFTEPDTGSDVAAVTLKATPTEGGWLLRGAKTWCTFAGKAKVIMVLARTNPDAAKAHRGLSLFLIEKPSTDGHAFAHNNPSGGSMTGRAIKTLGYRGMHSFEMAYDDWFVPTSHLVGEEEGLGRGFYYTMRGFMGGRLQTAARACGLMQAALNDALTYGAARRAFGQPVASFPLTQAKYVRMAGYLLANQAFAFDVAQMMDAGGGSMEASLVKLLACRHAEWVCREGLQIYGGMGYAEETAMSRYFVDARVLSIFEGAEETLAVRVVGKGLLDAAAQKTSETKSAG